MNTSSVVKEALINAPCQLFIEEIFSDRYVLRGCKCKRNLRIRRPAPLDLFCWLYFVYIDLSASNFISLRSQALEHRLPQVFKSVCSRGGFPLGLSLEVVNGPFRKYVTQEIDNFDPLDQCHTLSSLVLDPLPPCHTYKSDKI